MCSLSRTKVPSMSMFTYLPAAPHRGCEGSAVFVCFPDMSFRFTESVSQHSPPSVPSPQVTGLVLRRCHGHRPSPATPRSRAKRLSSPCPGQAATDSATAPASFNDPERATAGQTDSLSWTCVWGHCALCLLEDQLQQKLKWVGSSPVPSGRFKTGVPLP